MKLAKNLISTFRDPVTDVSKSFLGSMLKNCFLPPSVIHPIYYHIYHIVLEKPSASILKTSENKATSTTDTKWILTYFDPRSTRIAGAGGTRVKKALPGTSIGGKLDKARDPNS